MRKILPSALSSLLVSYLGVLNRGPFKSLAYWYTFEESLMTRVKKRYCESVSTQNFNRCTPALTEESILADSGSNGLTIPTGGAKLPWAGVLSLGLRALVY